MPKKILNGQEVEISDAELADIGVNTSMPAPVPSEVSNFQGRTWLRTEGLFALAQSHIDAIGDTLMKAIAQDAFDRGAFLRSSQLIADIAGEIGLTEAQIDDGFRQAALIQA